MTTIRSRPGRASKMGPGPLATKEAPARGRRRRSRPKSAVSELAGPNPGDVSDRISDDCATRSINRLSRRLGRRAHFETNPEMWVERILEAMSREDRRAAGDPGGRGPEADVIRAEVRKERLERRRRLRAARRLALRAAKRRQAARAPGSARLNAIPDRQG